MPVKIRLQRKGRKKKPFYYIVVADSRAPRDGKFIQKVGTYNPLTKPATIDLDRDEALDWLQKGAQPSDTVRRILSYKGVLYKKHLLRGVKLGLFDEQAAQEKFDKWLKEHEDKELKVRERQTSAKQKEHEAAEKAVAKALKDKEEAVEKEKEEAKKAEAEKAEAEKADATPTETKEEAPKEAEKTEEKEAKATSTEAKEEVSKESEKKEAEETPKEDKA